MKLSPINVHADDGCMYMYIKNQKIIRNDGEEWPVEKFNAAGFYIEEASARELKRAESMGCKFLGWLDESIQ